MACVGTSLTLPTYAKTTKVQPDIIQVLQPDEEFSYASEGPMGSEYGSEQSRMGALVGKFAGNIYKDEFFTDSVYYDYLEAFW